MKDFFIMNRKKLLAAVGITAALTIAFFLGGKWTEKPSDTVETSFIAVSQQIPDESVNDDSSESSAVESSDLQNKSSTEASRENSTIKHSDKKTENKQSSMISETESQSDEIPEKSEITEEHTIPENPEKSKPSREESPDIRQSPESSQKTESSAKKVPVHPETSRVSEKSKVNSEQSRNISEPVISSAPEEKSEVPESEDEKNLHCSIVISCETALNNSLLPDAKRNILPSDGIILKTDKISFSQGENVIDVLRRVCRENNIVLSAPTAPFYGGAYIAGIQDLCEFDCGPVSGWMYKVNDEFPNVGCSFYKLSDNDSVEIVYSCDLGKDVGNEYSGDE